MRVLLKYVALHKNFFALFLILLVAAFFVFYALGQGTFSLDESVAANLSWNTLRFGYPRAWDGRNFITLHNGAEFNWRFTWVLHPWLSFYVKTPSLWLVGKSALGLRLPMAIFGMLTLVLIYAFALQVTADKQFALLALLLSSGSVPLLLLLRQGHYYAFAMFFVVAALYCYWQFLNEAQWKNVMFLAVSLVVIFYTNNIYLLPLWAGIVAHYLLFALRNKPVKQHLKFWWGMIGVILCMLPWVILVLLPLASVTGSVISGFNHGVYGFVSNLFALLWKFQVFTYPFVALGVAFGLVLLFTKKTDAKALPDGLGYAKTNLSWIVLVGLVIGFNWLSASLLWKHPWLPYRYLLFGILLGPLLCAYNLWALYKRQKLVGIIFVVVVLFTNWLHILPYSFVNYLKIPARVLPLVVKSPHTGWLDEDDLYGFLSYRNRPTSYLWNFVREITTKKLGRTEAVVQYLNQHAAPEDVVLMETVEEDNIIFFTDLRVADRMGMRMDSFLGVKNLYSWDESNARFFSSLNHYPPEKIKWIISGNYVPPSQLRLLQKDKYVPIRICAQDYYLNPLQDIDIERIYPWEDRPTSFWIYRRKEEGKSET